MKLGRSSALFLLNKWKGNKWKENNGKEMLVMN